MSDTKLRIRLSDADRARYGCPEWLEVDLYSMTAREAMVLQRGVDLGDGLLVQFDGPGAWRAALNGTEVVDDAGNPVMLDVVLPDGTTEQRPRRRADFAAEVVTVWLALRRAGGATSLVEAADFDRDGWDWQFVVPPSLLEEDEPGKDEDPDQSTRLMTSEP